ncbi:MAG: carboxypeptidase-like regulatory domain-containing protein [Bacteroidales bacterium]
MHKFILADFKLLKAFPVAITLFLFVSLPGLSQTGSIHGVVKDKASGETLPGASIVIAGTDNKGTTTNFDGIFEITGLHAGNHDLRISYISYKTEHIKNIEVVAGQSTEIRVDLETQSQVLGKVEVVAEINRQYENLLLLERQKATEMFQQIGAQELSRKGVSDVATAVTKITGISKVEGSNDIYVRGLGDRYNSTTLNGLPIPSNNPEQKNISLEIFTTDIVEYLSVDKVYNNHFYGDFAGGNVDIISKDFSGDSYINIDLEGKMNTRAVNENTFPLKDGPDYVGFHTSSPPNTIAEYDFDYGHEPVFMTPVGSGYTVSGGNKHNLGDHKDLNYFAVLGFSNDFSTKEGLSLNVNSNGYPAKDLRMTSYSYKPNTTGMLNLGHRIDRHNKINYNFLFINSAGNSSEFYNGTILDIADHDNGLLQRFSYEKNTLLINQLLGSHEINRSADLSWGLAYNTISSDIPDRLQNTFRMVDSGDYVFGQNQITDNHRYYHYLNEQEFALNTKLDYTFLSDSEGTDNPQTYRLKLSLGYTGRYKLRDFEATQFNFRIHTDQRNTVVDPDHLSSFFNQENLDKGNFFRIETFRGSHQVPSALDPQVYGGTQIIHGGFMNAEYKISPALTALIGLRGEYIHQEVSWNTQLDPSDKSDAIETFEFLPSITTRYKINERQNLRFAASKTYTLPQFKERALFIYEDVTQVKLGNPDLYQSENYNVDVKWELFPGRGEIIALGIFGKHIVNPINEVTISSATNDISFLNTGNRGHVAGIELEARKNLINNQYNILLAGFNIAYMHTEQELNSEKIQEETNYMVQFTHDKARFTGASDMLINTDITWVKKWQESQNKLMTTLSYGYFSDRIYAIGTNQRGNMIDKAFGSLDLIIKSEFNNLSLGVSLKNILNPKIETYQANSDRDITIMSYKKGMGINLSMSYKF